jgi:hypothetical protein
MIRTRKRQRIRLTIGDIALIEFGFAEGTSGVIFFMNLPGRNIHLTYYERNGVINCHIKDNQKQPSTVWQIEMGAQELIERLTRTLRRSISKYNWNETYLMFQPPMLKFMEQFSGIEGEDDGMNFNLLDTLSIFSSTKTEEDLLVRARIRDGLKLGNRPGFQYSLSQSYILFPLDKRLCFRMNANIKKSFIGKTPFGLGILEYMKYLEREVTDSDMKAYINKGSVDKAKVAMETALLALTADVTPMEKEA